MSTLILHHYPQSPVAEKVRVVLGMKNLAWHSVTIPRLPPKPDLVALTGGYRRTPVLQIGADVFCDSQCIIRELETRFPRPTLYPGGGAGMVWGVSRWTDGPLFTLAITVVLAANADALPADFAADRGRLYFGPRYDLKALEKDLPHTLAQLRAQLGWIEQRLADGRDYLLGRAPGLPDALCYHVVWFLRGRYGEGTQFLGQFPLLLAWEKRVRGMGHGHAEQMEAAAAIDVAHRARPRTPERGDADDPEGWRPGMHVGIAPDGEGGDPVVTGRVVSVGVEEIAIARSDPRVGDVVVHFPRVGYRVRRKP